MHITVSSFTIIICPLYFAVPQPFVFSTISAVFLKMVLLLPFGHSAVCEPFSLVGNLFLPFLGSYTPFPPFPLAIQF